MAITTYSELQTAVQNWLDDTNTLPAARCQEFIALAEADINRRLRVRAGRSSTSGTTTAGTATITLPARFGGVVSLGVTVSGYDRPLEQIAPNAALEAYYAYGNGEPGHYAVEASAIRLFPTPDAEYTYTLHYWERLAALSDSNTSNWLLTAAPDVYLFGALVHAEGFRANDARMPTWRVLYDQALEQLLQESAQERTGRGYMWTDGGTP
ncbi:MAG: hypothetical protein MUE59_06185 [Thiobacillaceae bacterium]|jgi:hypothetical protein|nr:hypothetical protein [Thiobacillaceae bacterium]